MSYCLDSNICIYALKGVFPKIQKKISTLNPSAIKIPTIVKGELLLGAKKSNNPDKALMTVQRFLIPYEVLSFDEPASLSYAEIRHQLEIKGTPIGANDLIIAATCLSHHAVLVTHNGKEFGRIAALKIEDWTQ